MIEHPVFSTEPWCLRERGLELDVLAQTESVFALSNVHIGWRGNLDEGEPYGLPGSYLNGVFEIRPLPYAERGYGNPESGQTIINVTNGKVIRLLVNDEPFDIRFGELRSHENAAPLQIEFTGDDICKKIAYLCFGLRLNSANPWSSADCVSLFGLSLHQNLS